MTFKDLRIPVIDLFAGPGGLGEGFSQNRLFSIKLSIEKDAQAHKTLELRSFYRQFERDSVPEEYYDLLRSSDIAERERMRTELFGSYKEEAVKAQDEAWRCELGGKEFSEDQIDARISSKLSSHKNWVLIGGPPCQAYSMAGRSRVGGINPKDHRVYLYKEYLRIIAKHHPAVFVMENVRGLLSAKVGEEKVFNWIKRDLQNPGSVFADLKSPDYKVYSLSTQPSEFDADDNPVYAKDSDFLIKSELFGVPQKRHRVILIGIRADIENKPGILEKTSPVTLEEVIRDLPPVRSAISRKFVKTSIVDGKKKRVYKKIPDSYSNWMSYYRRFVKDISKWNGFAGQLEESTPDLNLERGSEFVACESPSNDNPLYSWYGDERLGGVCNHESRSHLLQDLKRYLFSSVYTKQYGRFPRIEDIAKHRKDLLPDHQSANTGVFNDRFRVQLPDRAATTITSHISKDGHYFIHYDPKQCRSFTVREAARVQTFPDNYLFCGSRTSQFHQVGNAVPPLLANQISHIVSDVLNNNVSNRKTKK